MAEQQCANGAMADNEHIPSPRAVQNGLHLPHNPRLGGERGLPAADADGWGGKKSRTVPSNSGGGRYPVAERSFSCMASRIRR